MLVYMEKCLDKI